MNDTSTQQVDEGQCSKPTSKKDENCGNSKGMMIVYKECLKNHAAAIGAHSTDGCGEFMPSSGEDALLCSACGCHRNFHRKEVDMGGASHTYIMPECHFRCHNTSNPPSNQMPKGHQNEDTLKAGCGPHPTPGPRVGPAASLTEKVGEKIKVEEVILMNKKKRHRTRFSNEQKERMLGFAEKIGWKLQKGNEGLVQQFCQEIGIKKRVLKVWMHNNKHLFAKKISSNSNPNDLNASDDSTNHKQYNTNAS